MIRKLNFNNFEEIVKYIEDLYKKNGNFTIQDNFFL